MTIIESDKIPILVADQKIFTFLADLNNFEELMPEQVTEWESTRSDCSFNINGMAVLAMKIELEEPFKRIVYKSTKEKPFDFRLISSIVSISDCETETKMVFEAELTPMLKMMLVRPLKNLLNILNDKLKELMEKY